MLPRREFCVACAIALACSSLVAQTPRPFPQPNRPPTAPAPATSQPVRPAQPNAPAAKAAPAPNEPSEATLGVPIYPGAQFITSYDAGRGQRFYLFGVSSGFFDMVTYYRSALKQKGSELFETPPTHQFEIGRFREETMAFPPSVTIKDYTFGGSAGYANPKRGAQPARFPTIIQIVPPPPGTPPGY
jgi:hypothetical protein